MVAYTKPQKGKKKEMKDQEEREIRPRLLIVNVKDGKL